VPALTADLRRAAPYLASGQGRHNP
jgi:hypothetical protein